MTGRRPDVPLAADDGPTLLPPTPESVVEDASPREDTSPQNRTITITIPRFWARAPRVQRAAEVAEPPATQVVERVAEPSTTQVAEQAAVRVAEQAAVRVAEQAAVRVAEPPRRGRHKQPRPAPSGRPWHRVGIGAVALAAVVAASMAGDSPLTHTELDSHDPGRTVTESAASPSGSDASGTSPSPGPGSTAAASVPGPTGSPTPGGSPGTSPAAQGVALPVAAPSAPLPVTPKVGQSSAPQQLASSGIPARAKQAYTTAAAQLATIAPTCKIPWNLIAAIGRVESNHGRFGGSTIVASSGRVTPPIFGVRLDGSTRGTSVVRDTDRGTLDGDPLYERAVGPMQFLPGTWRAFQLDADGDGAANPQDIDDAALTAGRYLCTGGGDLSTATGQWSAAFRYNRSTSYANLVLALSTTYATGRAATVVNPPKGATTTVPTVTLTVTPVAVPATTTITRTPTPTPTTPTTTATATVTSTSSGSSGSGSGGTVTVTTTPGGGSTPPGSTVTVTVTVVTVTVTGQGGSSSQSSSSSGSSSTSSTSGSTTSGGQ